MSWTPLITDVHAPSGPYAMELSRRAFLRLTVGGAAALGMASCQRSSKPPAPATPDLNTPAARVKLRLASGDYGFPSPFGYLPPAYGLMTNIYDTLLLADASDTLQPWLASKYERSGDGLIYTFELRDNVRWHDGRPLTVDDVVFSFDYFKAKLATLPPFILFRPDNVSEVRPVGARNVQIRLDKPVVTFARAVAGRFPIVPKHVWSSINQPAQAQDLKVLVGTGPYRLESYSRGQGAYLYTANDDFFLGKPFVRRVEFRPVEDELNALRAGELDAAGPPASGAPVGRGVLAPFRSDPAYGIIEGDHHFPTALYWNQAKGGAMADVRFRQACAKAIDREDLVKRVLGGLGKPGNPGFLPPEHPMRVDVEQYPFDRTGAERLLDDAGYRRAGKGARQGLDGKPLRVKVTVFPQLSAVVELVVNALKAVGIDVQLDPVEPFQFFTSQVDYEMAIFFYGGVSEDPDYMRLVYSSTAKKTFQSARGYVNRELDDLSDRQQVAFDEAERRRLVVRMQEIVAQDLPLLHLYYPTPFLVYRKALFGAWATERNGQPLTKQALVTGTQRGLQVRPIKEGN